MKKELLISGILTVLLIGGVFVFNKKPIQPKNTTLPIIQSTPTETDTTFPSLATRQTTPTSTQIPAIKTVTKNDVQKHNKANDCWIIISNKAYDVTSYLLQHPGGSEIVIEQCGNDATDTFNTIKKGRGHSEAANQDLQNYFMANVQ